jgi:hypothetical protein
MSVLLNRLPFARHLTLRVRNGTVLSRFPDL